MPSGNLVYTTSRSSLRWALLAWIMVTGILLAVDDGPQGDIAELSYQVATGIGFLTLAWFGLLSIYFRVIKDFSVTEILITTAALGIGGYGTHVSLSVLSPSLFTLSVFIVILGQLTISIQLRRAISTGTPSPASLPVHEPTIRGTGAVLATGPDGVRMVQRQETGRNTPAERFERRLIRYIERALEVEAVSMAGSNASYWRFRLPNCGNVVEMIVVGPGYNTASTIKESERWLLRVREYKPCPFTEWLGQHFGPDVKGVIRDLGASRQTMFASSLLTDDNQFFTATLPWAALEDYDEMEWRARRDSDLVVLHVWANASSDNQEKDGDNDLVTPLAPKPTLH